MRLHENVHTLLWAFLLFRGQVVQEAPSSTARRGYIPGVFARSPLAGHTRKRGIYFYRKRGIAVGRKRERTSRLAAAYDWLEIAVKAVILVAVCFALVGRMVKVQGVSMEPTLHEGDRLFITRIGGVKAGDIVVSAQPNTYNELLIKRVIATEGQEVDIDFETGEVKVDGEVLDEPYIAEPTRLAYDVQFPVTVGEGCVFLMGDNRNHSIDSRSTDIGQADLRYLVGKVVFR
ncbi:MAG: signal peptidase I [Oscillospiraceae bacterium]|nr:signal peptidase I [Oscillospiraceae bacterium]